ARLGLVGVDHQVARPTVRGRQEAPLQARREARTAATAEAGVLGHLDQVGLLGLQRGAQALVAAVGLVGLQGPARGVVPEPGQDRGQLSAHASFSFSASEPLSAAEVGWFPASGRWDELCSSPVSGSESLVVSSPASSAESRSAGGAVQPCSLASFNPSSEAGPAPTPSSAKPSGNPASSRETCLKLHTLEAPRVGVTSAPERRSSTSRLVLSGVWLS